MFSPLSAAYEIPVDIIERLASPLRGNFSNVGESSSRSFLISKFNFHIMWTQMRVHPLPLPYKTILRLCVSEIPRSGILQKASQKKKSLIVFNPFAQTALSKIADRDFLRLRLSLNGAVQGTPYPDALPRFFECNTAGSAACFTPQTSQTITSKCQIDWGILHGSFKRNMAAKAAKA